MSTVTTTSGEAMYDPSVTDAPVSVKLMTRGPRIVADFDVNLDVEAAADLHDDLGEALHRADPQEAWRTARVTVDELKQIEELLRAGLSCDGVHHKQWHLAEIGRILNTDLGGEEDLGTPP